MNNELLRLIKNHTDTLIEQTKKEPQELLEIKMNKQMQVFSFNPPISLSEEEKWLLAVTSLETTKSVFNKTNENKSFSITIPRYWSSRGGVETIQKTKNFSELRSQNDLELHVEEVRKTGKQITIGEKDIYYLSLILIKTR